MSTNSDRERFVQTIVEAVEVTRDAGMSKEDVYGLFQMLGFSDDEAMAILLRLHSNSILVWSNRRWFYREFAPVTETRAGRLVATLLGTTLGMIIAWGIPIVLTVWFIRACTSK